MKNDVLEFLAADNEKPQEKFNKALRLYRSSKNNDESQVRFMNRLGYSPARLEDLLYLLKTLHGISDVELATARNKGKKQAQEEAVKGSVKLLIQALDEIDAEKMDLKDLKETESILSKEFNRIPESDVPEELSGKLDGFYEALNKKHFANEFNELREKMEGMDDEQLLNALSNLPEERMPQDLGRKFNELRNQANSGVNDNKVKQLDVNAPEEVKGEMESEGIEKDDQENNSEDQDKTSEEKEEAPVEDQDKTPEKEVEPKKEVPEAIQKLDGFDVEASDYNTIKSFAAELGDAIKKTPKDQKGATLKAFITEAKKKHSKA